MYFLWNFLLKVADTAANKVKNPNIIVYDEALSSLPKERETELIKVLISKFKDKTMVFATNNQEIINTCDLVIPLRNGKIVEDIDKGVIQI